MRALVIAFAGGLAAAPAALAAPLAPEPASKTLSSAPPIELVAGLRVGLASRPLARPLGALALALRSVWLRSPRPHQPRTSLRGLARSYRGLW